MDDTRARPVFASTEKTIPGLSRLVHHGYAHRQIDNYYYCLSCIPIYNCMTCICLSSVQRELRRSTYVQVYDNHVEVNQPFSCLGGFCCTCNVYDNITKIHYDRSLVANAHRAGNCCAPHCSHMSCFPDCCGCWGESLVIYSEKPQNICCCSEPACKTVNRGSAADCLGYNFLPCCCCCICPQSIVVRGIENAAEVANHINTQRNLRALPKVAPPF
jgi:hypothetical protein